MYNSLLYTNKLPLTNVTLAILISPKVLPELSNCETKVVVAELFLLTMIYLLFDVYIMSPDIDLPAGKLNNTVVVNDAKLTEIT